MTEKGMPMEFLKFWYIFTLWLKKKMWGLMGRKLANTVIYKNYIYLIIQMTKIYFSYTVGLHPQFLDYRYPNPWNFLSNGSIFCYIWSLVLSS